MRELYNFFQVVKTKPVGDNGNILVEECSAVDSALEGYYVICSQSDVPAVLQWIDENCKAINDYIKQNFNNGAYAFALNLVKSTIGIGSFTDEFIKESGSVQGFLDKYGRVSDVVEFNNDTVEPVQPVPNPEVEPAQPVPSPMLFKDDVVEDTDGLPSCLASYSENIDPAMEVQAAQLVSEPVVQSVEPVSLSKPAVPVSLSKPAVPVEPVVQPVSEPVPEPTTPVTLTEQEIDALTKPVEPVQLEPEPVNPTVPQEGIPYAVECSGIQVQGVQFKDGKFVVPFNELSNLVTSIISASNIIEHDSSKELKLLTSSSKIKAAQVVDRYSPSVIKEFIMRYILTAENDVDFIRITAMLNEFCNFIMSNKIKEM